MKMACRRLHTTGRRDRTRLAVGHDRRVAAVKHALDELLRRVRVDAVLRRRFIKNDVELEGLLVVGRFQFELVLGTGGRARRAFREGSHAHGYSHAFARRGGCGFVRRGGGGGGRVGRRGRVLRVLLLSSHFVFARPRSRGGAAAGVLVIVERCEKA
jgi:hypothetical protein